jgi:hypothetical protein
VEFPEPRFHIVLQLCIGYCENYLIDWMLLEIDFIVLLTGWAWNHFHEGVKYTDQGTALIAFV